MLDNYSRVELIKKAKSGTKAAVKNSGKLGELSLEIFLILYLSLPALGCAQRQSEPLDHLKTTDQPIAIITKLNELNFYNLYWEAKYLTLKPMQMIDLKLHLMIYSSSRFAQGLLWEQKNSRAKR